MREQLQSFFRFCWATPFFGTQQVARLLLLSEQNRSLVTSALNEMNQVAQPDSGSPLYRFSTIGKHLVNGAVDLTFDALDPVVMTELNAELAERTVEGFRLYFPARNIGLAMVEIRNKIEVFVLVAEVARIIDIPPEAPIPLRELVDRSYELGPYPALWAVEGLGHDYSDSFWSQEVAPQQILSVEATRSLPASSLLMLHAGIGLSFAQKLLPGCDERTSDAELQGIAKRFADLCKNNSQSGFIGAAYESLGLVTRTFYPYLVPAVDRALRAVAPDITGFFWHGVGRAIYFQPRNFFPCSDWPSFEMARREAPDEMARRNIFAGLAWAFVLVNQRQPEVLANLLLQEHGDDLMQDNAFANGVASSVIMRAYTTPDASFISTFCEYRPSSFNPRLERLWDELIVTPCRQGLESWYPALDSQNLFGEVFKYHEGEPSWAAGASDEKVERGAY